MTLKLKRPLVVFDLETTGIDLVNSKIIQISYIKVYPDGKEERGNQYINPEQHIPEEVTAITHITDDDVIDQPTFKEVASQLAETFKSCDFAGFNSNRFDIPLLEEEFLRSGIDFDFSKSRLIDAQVIYHKMEPRNLSAAYRFYTGHKMEDDFQAHKADQDTEATYRVLTSQLDFYSEEKQDEKERCLENDIDYLHEFSKQNRNVDFAGRIVYNDKDVEVFNFGKYRNQPVAEVLKKDPGYYSWILQSDFTLNTKQVLTRIRLREFNK
jgi:DNA polymerase III subunit epsilon